MMQFNNTCTDDVTAETAVPEAYNNCFVLSGLYKQDNGKKLKQCYFIKDGVAKILYTKTAPENIPFRQLTYQKARQTLDDYFENGKRQSGDESLRVSIWLENAKWGNLSLFCIDFDEYDEQSGFFRAAYALADKITRSQSGGYHMWYGVDRQRAEPLFDSINLTTRPGTKSFVCNTRNVADGNRVDFFCENGRLIHEYEEWDNTKGVTDQTESLFELLNTYFTFKEKRNVNDWQDAEGRSIQIEGLPKELLLQEMTDRQRLVFEDLQTISPDCTQSEWYRTGVDIKHVFGEELGGSVFLWWSKPGQSFQQEGLANTWNDICNRNNELWNCKWQEIVEVNAFDIDLKEAASEQKSLSLDKKSSIELQAESEKEDQGKTQSQEAETDNPLNLDNDSMFFRNRPIKWVNITRYKTTEIENAFIDDIEVEERYNGKNHLIGYDEKEYTQDGFFETYFERYREVKKRVQFNSDTLNRLNCISTNQCEKLQYHILAQYFDLVEVDEQDERELRNFAFYYDSSFKRLYNRINWENGLSKMITFGAGLQAAGRGKVEKMYCYQQYLEHDKAEYIAVNMTWETWSIAIIERAEMKQIDEAIMAMYYQNKINDYQYNMYMTWTAAERNVVEHWIRTYKSGAVFPYSGEIERGENFTIVFDSDCEIVDNIRTRETRAQYNKEHAAELAAARGKIKHSKAAMSDYKRLIGENWTTAELLTMLDNNSKKIKRLVDEGLIERIKRGYYRRKTS